MQELYLGSQDVVESSWPGDSYCHTHVSFTTHRGPLNNVTTIFIEYFLSPDASTSRSEQGHCCLSFHDLSFASSFIPPSPGNFVILDVKAAPGLSLQDHGSLGLSPFNKRTMLIHTTSGL